MPLNSSGSFTISLKLDSINNSVNALWMNALSMLFPLSVSACPAVLVAAVIVGYPAG